MLIACNGTNAEIAIDLFPAEFVTASPSAICDQFSVFVVYTLYIRYLREIGFSDYWPARVLK